ncbi:MAG: hypothetical protein IJV75_00360 [Alphaproteobacteria bacterium]|nr:hypothetical protein [Alphaproteobacteria bacterium]MBQ9737955.1 hypothetical protein [Alphaproteobacteria bacterium]
MKDRLTISETLQSHQTDDFIKSLWYDWFCSDKALLNKGRSLLKKLKAISKSNKFDTEKTYVFFKNCCPMNGNLYDQFKICDIETGDVLYCITPKSGHAFMNGKGDVWGKENDFMEPLFVGSWKEIKEWFLK